MGNRLSEVISEIESDISNIEDEAGLLTPENFNARTDALDFIDFHIIDRIDGLLESWRAPLSALKQRAESLKGKLGIVNKRLFDELQIKTKSGEYRDIAFEEMISRYIGNDVIDDKIGYDNLDIFINGLLDDHDDVPETRFELEPEMVFYQKTPVRIVFELAKLAQMGRDDVFFDLGSGLGQVAILMNLITGVKTRGIEYDPGYYSYAKRCAQHFCLRDAEFINADARNTDYSAGTVFFMYTPFGGQMQDDVLELLRKASQKRPIRVFTYGPCSHQVAQQSWLTCLSGDVENSYKLCQFRNEG